MNIDRFCQYSDKIQTKFRQNSDRIQTQSMHTAHHIHISSPVGCKTTNKQTQFSPPSVMLRLRSHDRKRDSCSRLMVFHIDCQVHEVPVAHHHESSHEDRDGVFSHQERAGVGLPADFAFACFFAFALARLSALRCRWCSHPAAERFRQFLVWTSRTVAMMGRCQEQSVSLNHKCSRLISWMRLDNSTWKSCGPANKDFGLLSPSSSSGRSRRLAAVWPHD